MTGEKTRGTSLEKLWKLDDPELTTPKHDALVLSLLNWDYTKNLLSLDDEEFLISIKSEVPITTGRDFIVGYADLVLHTARWGMRDFNSAILFTCPHCGDVFRFRRGDSGYYSKVVCLKCGKDVCNIDNKESMNGILHQPLRYPCLVVTQFIIECKPTIRSFGETLRQIKTYRQYITDNSLFDNSLSVYGLKDKSKYPKCEMKRNDYSYSSYHNSPDKRYWIILSPDVEYSDAFANEDITLISPTI
jgi:hypothetical protein